jgi:acetoin utilization deacetylase AcuC-like enzyme
VLFCSTHLYNPDSLSIFPGTGSDLGKYKIHNFIDNTPETSTIFPGGILNVPLAPSSPESKSKNWRDIYTRLIFPRLLLFKPDLIFISAGFDAHEYDHIHTFGDTQLSELDY